MTGTQYGPVPRGYRHKKIDTNVCVSCGRSDWIDSVDNFGHKYIGCAHCRFVFDVPADVFEPARTGGRK